MSERPVVFPNKKGQNLVGIVHEPEGIRRDPLVIFVFGGVMGRVAQLRQYVTLARKICSHGYTVLRYDSHNMGECVLFRWAYATASINDCAPER